MRTWLWALLAVVAPIASAAAGNGPDGYPLRPVTFVVPFPAGSATDGVARTIAENLRQRIGQTVIVENKPGADGIIAAQAVARSAPDGYTLFVTSNSSHAVNVSLYRSLPYDPVKDFTPVSGLIKIMQMMCVRSDFPASDLKSFLAVAKSRPSKLNYGSGNTSSRAAAELLKAATGIDMTQVAYRGTPQALTDLVGGHIDLFFADPFSAMSLTEDRKIKVLAVTGRERLPSFPEAPTMIELGYPDFEVVSWVAAFLPAGANPAMADYLNREINAVLGQPDVREFLLKTGSSPFPTTREELGAFVVSEIAHWARIVDIAKIEKR